MITNTIEYFELPGHTYSHVVKLGGIGNIVDGEALLVLPPWGSSMITVDANGVEVMGPPAPEIIKPASWSYVPDDLMEGVYRS